MKAVIILLLLLASQAHAEDPNKNLSLLKRQKNKQFVEIEIQTPPRKRAFAALDFQVNEKGYIRVIDRGTLFPPLVVASGKLDEFHQALFASLQKVTRIQKETSLVYSFTPPSQNLEIYRLQVWGLKRKSDLNEATGEITDPKFEGAYLVVQNPTKETVGAAYASKYAALRQVSFSKLIVPTCAGTIAETLTTMSKKP